MAGEERTPETTFVFSATMPPEVPMEPVGGGGPLLAHAWHEERPVSSEQPHLPLGERGAGRA